MFVRRLFRAIVGLTAALAATLALAPGAQAASRYVQMSSKSAADPGFSKFGSDYYVYATGGAIYRGSSLHHKFKQVGTLKVPSNYSALWAPHVFASSGHYFALFTAIKSGNSQHCVYWSVSNKPTGGFGKPHLVACGNGWEAIDPSLYSHGGKSWVIWKRGHYTGSGFPHGDFEIRGAKVTVSGSTLHFSKQHVLVKAYNTDCMEAPSMIWHGNKVWLFVSRNRYDTNAYRTEVWSASSVTGKYHKVKTLMKNGQGWGHGPGGAEVLKSGGTTYIAYHAWATDKPTPQTSSKRVVRFAKISWSKKGPSMASL